MQVENPIGTAVSVYVTLIAGFAAITASTAIEEDDRENLPRRVGRSVTKTSLALGVPALLAFLYLLLSESKPGSAGIMSRELGVCILFVIGLAGVFGVWLGTFVMGLLGGAVAKNLGALPAALVVFLFTSGGAPLMLVLTLGQMALRR